MSQVIYPNCDKPSLSKFIQVLSGSQIFNSLNPPPPPLPHEFWAPKKLQNKHQETRRALKKHEFWAPTTNVRKLAGLSNNMYMSFRHQKTNVRKFAGLSKQHEFGNNQQLSGSSLGSQKTMCFGHQKQMSGNSPGSQQSMYVVSF